MLVFKKVSACFCLRFVGLFAFGCFSLVIVCLCLLFIAFVCFACCFIAFVCIWLLLGCFLFAFICFVSSAPAGSKRSSKACLKLLGFEEFWVAASLAQWGCGEGCEKGCERPCERGCEGCERVAGGPAPVWGGFPIISSHCPGAQIGEHVPLAAFSVRPTRIWDNWCSPAH